jgi:3',5'-cyclic AMP phosphodiesterase CpdA
MPPVPPTPLLLATLPTWGQAAIALLLAWAGVSAAIQIAAARARALGRRPAPACFRAPVPGAEAATVHLAFLGDLQRGIVDVAGPLGEALRAEGVDCLVSSGDFASHGEAPYYGILLDAFARAGIETPVRVVPGNHDLFPRRSKDDTLGGQVFEERFGPRHWALRAGPVLLVGLDNGADWLLDDQLPWIEAQLREHAGVPWICVAHRPPFRFDAQGAPPYEDLAALGPFLEAHPPLLVVSGHLHDYRDETIRGVRYVVNAHGGDVHGLGLRRRDFELLHVRVSGRGGLTVEPKPYARRASWRTAWHQVLVRVWASRRGPLGAFLAWPAGALLRLLGREIPVPRHPEERRHPAPDVLRARRAAHAARTEEPS